jgi:hypothetical protein
LSWLREESSLRARLLKYRTDLRRWGLDLPYFSGSLGANVDYLLLRLGYLLRDVKRGVGCRWLRLWRSPVLLKDIKKFSQFNLYEPIVRRIRIFQTFKVVKDASHRYQVLGSGVPNVLFRVLETLHLGVLHIVFII